MHSHTNKMQTHIINNKFLIATVLFRLHFERSNCIQSQMDFYGRALHNANVIAVRCGNQTNIPRNISYLRYKVAKKIVCGWKRKMAKQKTMQLLNNKKTKTCVFPSMKVPRNANTQVHSLWVLVSTQRWKWTPNKFHENEKQLKGKTERKKILR